MNFLKNHPLLVTISVVAIVIVAASAERLISRQEAASSWGGGQAVLVTLASARTAEVVDEVESVGTALANESVTLTAKVTDTISKINFEDGMYVETGDILVELTNSEETALLAEAQATVEETTRQYNRVANLIDQNLASETQLDIEKARMETANARLEAIVARLDDRLIRAPFSGLLGFRNVSQGTLLSPTTQVTTLDDISLIKLDFSIPERYLSAVRTGQMITAKSAAYPDKVFSGEVHTVNSRVDPVSRSITIRAHLENEEMLLRPGMLLNVSLITHRVNALVVPEEAIIPIQTRSYVYVIDEKSTAIRKEVTVGRRSHGSVEILTGLIDGDQVVTQGIIKLRPGSTVRTRETAPG